jgi:hypothetical protein
MSPGWNGKRRWCMKISGMWLIMKIRLPSHPTEDFVSWFYEKSGIFLVRSAYRLVKELEEEERGGGQSSSRVQEGRPI